MPTDPSYAIADLARLTGVNVRTIRYYLAQGLLPASGEVGPGAHYGEGHLDRLRLTRRLQQQHLPLSEIRRRLAELTDDEVASVLATTPGPETAPTTSALEYVRTVLGAPTAAGAPTAPTAAIAPPVQAFPSSPAPARLARLSEPSPSLPSAAPSGDPPFAASSSSDQSAPPTSSAFLRIHATDISGGDAIRLAESGHTSYAEPGWAPASVPAPAPVSAPASAPASAEPPIPERSQWERLALGPNVELHVRRPLSRLEQKRVERFITIARQVLKEESP